MLTELLRLLLLASFLHAGIWNKAQKPLDALLSDTAPHSSSNPDNGTEALTSTSPPFNLTFELASISTTCITPREHEQILGDNFRSYYARIINQELIPQALQCLGLTELRAALGIRPPGAWTPNNFTKPSSEELASASTVQEYYILREPRNCLDDNGFSEQALPPVFAFFDKRIPAVRNIFRHRIQETLLDLGGNIDREAVDRLVHEFDHDILPTIQLRGSLSM